MSAFKYVWQMHQDPLVKGPGAIEEDALMVLSAEERCFNVRVIFLTVYFQIL